MAGTNHSHGHSAEVADIPVQPDGVSFRGVFWSVAIMFVTTIIAHGLMVLTFKFLDVQVKKHDTARAPLAAPQGTLPPAPNLLREQVGAPAQNEPGYLAEHRARDRERLHEYAVDQAAGTARIPIEQAKDLVIQRGLVPGEGTAPGAPLQAAAPSTPATTPAAAPAEHSADAPNKAGH